MKILKEKGIFAFICSNKFSKAKYGEKLRKLILENQLKIYNDFTGVKVFKEASVDTCVIQIKKDYNEDNEIYVNNNYLMKQNRLKRTFFSFNSPEILDLREKILNQGSLIKNLDIIINSGIKTGSNNAFIIDEYTKNKLVELDSKNKEIIKPILRGRDIHKWRIINENLYLIYVPWNFNINKYPSIKAHLTHYKSDLEKRPEVKKNRYDWYCLSRYASDYVDLFEEEKIIYSEISNEPSFTLDLEKHYLGNTAFIMNSDSINLKYLLGLLNSNVLFWIFQKICYNLGNKGFRFIKNFVEQLPIVIDNKNQNKVIQVVDTIFRLNNEIEICESYLFDILKNEYGITDFSKKIENFYLVSSEEFIKEVKKKNKNIDEDFIVTIYEKAKYNILNSRMELESNNAKLNNIVYQIYGLNEREVSIIEKNLNN